MNSFMCLLAILWSFSELCLFLLPILMGFLYFVRLIFVSILHSFMWHQHIRYVEKKYFPTQFRCLSLIPCFFIHAVNFYLDVVLCIQSRLYSPWHWHYIFVDSLIFMFWSILCFYPQFSYGFRSDLRIFDQLCIDFCTRCDIWNEL